MAFSKEHFQQHKFSYEAAGLFGYFAINATINATTELMEEARGSEASFHTWEPFVWEYSSALATLFIIPLIAWFMHKYPWDWQASKRSFIRYGLAALNYSMLHVFLMVAMREVVYLPTANDYQFAHDIKQLFFELFYELRKDIWGFCFFVAMFSIYKYIIAHWLGDAKSLSEESTHSQSSTGSLANILLVKKLGNEFLVKTKHIEWIEACGNYANLNVGTNVYPMRITMSDFIDKSSNFGFIRVHKSFSVNLHNVNCIEPLASGDAEIVMQSGKKIRLSRRYKNDFEASVASL
jgi:two-component system LytT family response regulator